MKAQRLKLLEEMGSLVQADAADSERVAAERRKALRAEKDSVLETQRKEIDARWASEGQRAVEDAVGAVESGARALVDAARADAAQATGDAAVSRLMSLRGARGPRRGGAPRGGRVPPTRRQDPGQRRGGFCGAAGSRAAAPWPTTLLSVLPYGRGPRLLVCYGRRGAARGGSSACGRRRARRSFPASLFCLGCRWRRRGDVERETPRAPRPWRSPFVDIAATIRHGGAMA